MRKTIFAAALMFVAAGCSQNPEKALDNKVEETLSKMTLDEKIAVVHAQSKFSSPGVPRLGIPELWCDDGPHGVRPETLWDSFSAAGWTNDSCTAYPSLTCLAATWDTDLAFEYGKSVGEEARYRKKNVLLGPGINICRTPLCGRNFEYMGEDPLLAGCIAAQYVKGIQSNKVAACVKHFALNNQEFQRHGINVHLSERALREIYLPAFKTVVQEGGVWSIMSSYNRFEGEYASHNSRLLNDILKKEWGFDGAVISDWGAVHDTEGAAHGGLDLEFGTYTDGVELDVANVYDKYYLAEPYKRKILAGELPEDELDEKVRRDLRLNFRTEQDGYHGSFATPEHFALTRRIGADGIVLLKNNGVLPLRGDAKKIVVLGENAIRPMVVGGSSSSLKTHHETLPLDGIRIAFPEAEVVYKRAYYSGAATSGKYAYSRYDITDDRTPEAFLDEVIPALDGADYVIFVGGLNKNKSQDCESHDRKTYDMPGGQNEIIEKLAGIRPDLIYVNISGSPVAMPFSDKVAAIVQGWYLGSETGNALADVLTGKVNPSGKLPVTFPVALEDGPVKTERQYPGIQDENGLWQVYYDEGIYVGYRWYDSKNVEPLFPFGFGLSYTTFDYGEASARVSGGKLKVSVQVRNSGDVAGAEVVQLYVSSPADGEGPAFERPEQELKGFRKVFLAPGETARVTMDVPVSSLGYYNEERAAFITVKGNYTARIGASSRDIRAQLPFKIK
ncbi:MAG: glycoside hydrolase family 3 C-terminal domain-containing protein [Bacteroidales bacterium]|nr:glycoside hydrolase family 3 C-terminal domain-containing protein [Bacteroidales bacterium]